MSFANHTVLTTEATHNIGVGVVYHGAYVVTEAAGAITIKDGTTVLVDAHTTNAKALVNTLPTSVTDGVRIRGMLSVVKTGTAAVAIYWE